jgi:PAS domain S-box-containing protein
MKPERPGGSRTPRRRPGRRKGSPTAALKVPVRPPAPPVPTPPSSATGPPVGTSPLHGSPSHGIAPSTGGMPPDGAMPPAASVVLAHDVTRHVQADAARQESEDPFRAITDAIPLPMAITRLSDSRILYANGRFLALFGYTPEDVHRRTVMDFVGDDEARLALRAALMRGDAAVERQLQVRRADGAFLWVTVSMRRMLFQGEPAVIGVSFDDTQRKRTEEALVAAEAKFRSLVEQSLVGTYIIQDGRFQYVNPQMAEIFGHAPREMLAAASALDFVDKADLPRVKENLRRNLEGDAEIARYAFRGRRRDGTPVDVEIHGTRTEFNGRPAVIGTLLDITERKRAEEALQYRLDFEKLVSSLSTQFINLDLGEIDNGIHRALKAVGEFCRVDRSYVFLRTPEGSSVDNTHEWCAEGVASYRDQMRAIPLSVFPWVAERLLSGQPLHIPRVADLPPEAQAERDLFQREGTRSVVTVPLVRRGAVVGLLGFDAVRKEMTWTDDTIALLNIVGQIIVNALERKRTEEALRYRIEFEKLISTLSAQFINLPMEQIDDGIHSALRSVGEFLGVDRSYVFLRSADGATVDNTHEWCAKGIRAAQSELQGVPVTRFSWLGDRLLKGQPVHIPRVADLPPEARAERDRFLPQGEDWSITLVPMTSRGNVVGVLGLDSFRAAKAWSDDTIALLTIVGQIIMNAVEHKRAEHALRRSQALFESIFRSSQAATILSVFEDGRCVDANDAYARMTGYARDELVGRSILDLDIWHDPEERKRIMADLSQHRRQSGVDILIRTKSGKIIHTIASGEILRIDGRDHVLSFFFDITERKQAEEALRESAHRLEQAHRQLQENQAQFVQSEKMAALGLLAAGVAHEINNPVGFVMSNLGTLGDYVGVFKRLIDAHEALSAATTEEDRAAARARIEEIRRKEDLPYILRDVDALLRESQDGAHRVKEIIQALRSFARADEGDRVEVNVNEGLEATLKVVWNEIKYKCTLVKRLAPVPTLPGYPGQLNQVFLNLILNAAQAIPEKGEITVETAAEAGHVVVRISDNGVGIPPENLSKLFSPFFTTKPVGKGTGLGLSISYNIVRKHRGTIEVRSETGRGTTFTVRLPLPEGTHA